MIVEELKIKNEQSLHYAHATLFAHEHSDSIAISARPVIIICPGGGYEHTSDREAEIVAMQFLAMGYQTAVVRYSCYPAHYPTALYELAFAVRELRENAAKWEIDTDKVYVMGFSAGAHLAANYCSFWEKDFLSEKCGCDKEVLRPNGQILCYPVITSGPFAHDGSFKALLGEKYEEMKESLSMENQVTASVPKTFIWHTFEDATVPVQNSVMYVDELVKKGIPVEFHLFAKGGHGLSLGNHLSSKVDDKEVEPTVEPWISLLHTWIGKL